MSPYVSVSKAILKNLLPFDMEAASWYVVTQKSQLIKK